MKYTFYFKFFSLYFNITLHNELWLKTTINLIYLSSFALISRMHLKASWNLLKGNKNISYHYYYHSNINNNFYFSKRISDRHHHSDLRSTRSMRGTRREKEREKEKESKREIKHKDNDLLELVSW